MIINVNDFSLASYFVDVMRNDMKLSSATCFFTKKAEKLYLITNWHVVSGLNADTQKSLDDMCSIPNKLRVYLPAFIGEDQVEWGSEHYMDFQLLDDEEHPLWLEKRIGKRMIDVAVLPCDDITDFFYRTIEDAEEPFNDNVKYLIASEIYIIGFPFANQYGYTPIWKKASVASEPELDIEDLPYFFADTATKQGMSGSPVIMYKDRPVTILNKEKGLSRHITKFIGIYSGRIGADAQSRNDAQLGRVWKEKVIQDIIDENS